MLRIAIMTMCRLDEASAPVSGAAPLAERHRVARMALGDVGTLAGDLHRISSSMMGFDPVV
jgi:hypothetical protein